MLEGAEGFKVKEPIDLILIMDMNTLRRVYDDTKYSPTLATLEKLAKALGVKIADLIEEDDA